MRSGIQVSDRYGTTLKPIPLPCRGVYGLQRPVQSGAYRGFVETLHNPSQVCNIWYDAMARSKGDA